MTLLNLEIVDEASVESKEAKIAKILENKRVIVSFSGGVDSSVVAYLSKKYARESILVFQDGLSVGIGEGEIADAERTTDNSKRMWGYTKST